MAKIKALDDIDGLDTGVGFKLFTAIMQKWGVKPAQARILLGNIPRTTFHEWQKQAHPKLSHDTMVRISYIIGIVKGLRIIFGNTERADNWVNKPNKRLNGKTALEFMLHGEIMDMDYIRSLIDTARG
jgi:uncharacterized protein (DUF2384 family)